MEAGRTRTRTTLVFLLNGLVFIWLFIFNIVAFTGHIYLGNTAMSFPLLLIANVLLIWNYTGGAKESINRNEAAFFRILAALLLMSTMSFVLAEIIN
ncbi:hypothetical protein SAMN05421781_0436 [Marinococcus luteus]|uniref:Uncharacterized protein n=1 Tax=Marinococcus luteus TaxID=1122204 RepID=A0A1H2QRS9_9BACI|nr:hypothetical protein [Marinococcus luteus]SDW09805.1 hypothetical protein SAMN05421781_0436 [Marinococcus luteus]